MASTGLYKVVKSSDADLNLEGGYLKAWISLRADFTTLNEPVPGSPPAPGDAFKIGTDHVWTEGKEAIPCFVNRDILKADGESVGEVGTQRMIWRPELLLLGDSAALLENVSNWLNEEFIVFVQDGCEDPQYLQFGCDCYPAKVEKQTFTSAQLLQGQKGYTMTCRALCKYFYNGEISERTA